MLFIDYWLSTCISITPFIWRYSTGE